MSKQNYNEYDTDKPVAADLRLAVLGICLIACVLFAITLFIDIQAQNRRIYLPKWLSIGNVEDARVILSAIISAVSTVLGLVFSVVLLVLSMAATQFGPRLLRRFILNHNGQGSIGLFTATFIFSLFTLIVVGLRDGREFVPHLTIFIAIFLLIISFGSLIVFSHSIRIGIQTGNLIARVTDDLSKAITAYIALRRARAEDDVSATSAENTADLRKRCIAEGDPILASNAGYLQNINYGELIAAATKSDTIISLKVHPGQFIISGTVIAYVIPAAKGSSLIKNINNALCVGSNRTLTQDPEFAFAQIVEIGSRALSSAINDLFTGIACVDWLCNNILSLVELPETEGAWRDTMGHTRILEITVTFSRLVAAAFDIVRESGASSPAILIRLLQNFIRMGPYFKNNDQRSAIMRQANAILEFTKLQMFAKTDLDAILYFYDKACASIMV